jgi:hypothetical protein
MRRGSTLILLAVLASTGSPKPPATRADDTAPRFVITPDRVLHDRTVSIQLLNLRPNQRVTVRAMRGTYNSETEFVADAAGKIDVSGSGAKPTDRVAPLRILWSMKQDGDAKDMPLTGSIDPVKVSLTALADGRKSPPAVWS